jgi:tetratricopeptide (TPR) repeat protein
MLPFLIAASLSQADAPSAAQAAEKCDEQAGCVVTGPAQLFDLAEKLYKAGDVAGAASILEVLTQDVHLQIRSEARFRLAALREKMGDLKGAVEALRALLAEEPTANPARLELARILSRMGQTRAARAEIARAQAQGLPPEVEQNVRRFSSSLQSAKRRGISLEVSSGPDSNINRATNSQYVDTIIAPFQLSPDARRQPGVGLAIGGQAFIRNALLGSDLLTRVGGHADLFTKQRFNDVQLSIDIGPELLGKFGQIRPALVHERRWYGGNPYSTALGASAAWLIKVGSKTELELNASRVRQSIQPSRTQDGWRSFASIDVSRALGDAAGGRLTLRYAALDARVSPESVRQFGAGLFLGRRFKLASLYGQVDYTRTQGVAPIFLFGQTRRENRVDLVAGAVLHTVRLAGFSPLLRLTYSNSAANISIYDYQRTRLDLGISRSF